MSLQLEPSDRASLDALIKVIPGLHNLPEATVLRAIVRLGMVALAANPSQVLVDTPNADDLVALVRKSSKHHVESWPDTTTQAAELTAQMAKIREEREGKKPDEPAGSGAGAKKKKG